MKNWKVLMLAITAFFVPMLVEARNVDYDVTHVYMNADVDMVGSLHIREAVIVKGSLNGFERKLTYQDSTLKSWEPGAVDFSKSSIYNARGIVLSKISAMKIDKEDIGWSILDLDFEKFEEKTSAYIGEESVYTTNENSNGQDVRIYAGNDSGYMVYYFDYYVDQAIVLHNDVAELFYGFFRLDNDNVGEVNIQVLAADGNPKDVFRIWGHGGLSGEISPIEGKKDSNGNPTYRGAILQLRNYEHGEDVTIRMTLDKRGFNGMERVLNYSEQDALESIEKIENERGAAADRKRVWINVIYYGMAVIAGIYLIGLIVLWVYMYKKYDKEYDVGFDHKYYREFTGDYNVEVVDYLMTKNISTNAFSASIMNLIYKKNIDFEEIPNEKKNMTLVLKSQDGLNDTENKLIKLLFEDIGKEGKVTLKEIENYSAKYTTAEKFMKSFESWKLSATKDAMAEDFYESHNSPRALASLYFILGIIIFAIMMTVVDGWYVLSITVLLGAIAFLIYVLSFKKWSKKGREHYLKWSAFKNFLLDFGSFKDKEIPEIKLWDKYLVYATVFGIAKEVQKAMKVQLSNMGMDESMMMHRTFYYNDFYLMNSINNSMVNAQTKAMNVVNAHNANSSMSSTGFGGGLSGGGGFSGGGGGGGGGGF